jgi:hypothetical protein
MSLVDADIERTLAEREKESTVLQARLCLSADVCACAHVVGSVCQIYVTYLCLHSLNIYIYIDS